VAKLQGLPADRERPAAPARETRATTPFTEQLHLKLKTAPVAPVPRRNPFVFGVTTRRADVRDTRTTEAAGATIDSTAVAVPSGPSLRLSGIGSTTTEAGPVRTAIISDGRTVHLVKVGETVTGYAVILITDDSATIENAAGAQWTLRLK
jgi:hypothetical protein